MNQTWDEEDAEMPYSNITVGVGTDIEEADQNERNDIFNIIQMIAANTFNIGIGGGDHGRLISSQCEILLISIDLWKRASFDAATE